MSYPATVQRPITFIHVLPVVPVALAGQMITDSREHAQWSNAAMLRRDQSLITNWILVRGNRTNRLRGIAPGVAEKQSDRAIQLTEV